ncbi:MAG: SLBB domain-containing protein [Treponema sp.]|jgi:electron transport complex protein RnfC|nr:SLBB domain-containing protein [Treponema sp.]
MITKIKVYTFSRGGIHFTDPSAPSRDTWVTAFLPALSIIPLVHHTGSRVLPVVSVGDSVKEGMLVGRGQDPGSANIHATVPGKVVRTVSWKMIEGHTNDALVIRMEGAFDKLGRREEVFPWRDFSPEKLQTLVSEYGVVSMEGSGLPVSELLASFQAMRGSRSLVVRCVFDDPWLAADYVLCRERLKAIVEGSVIAARASLAKRIIYAISQRERELEGLFLAEASAYDIPASAVIVSSRYPQQNRRELEIVLRIYAKRAGIDLGEILLLGPATLAAIHDAVKLHRPILDRYVAVGGTAVKKPQVMKVRIGTRIRDIFEECGGFTGTPGRIATGSPFLGRVVQDLDEPVIKTSYAVFAFLKKRIGKVRNCIGCGECRAVCPVGLDPEELFKAAGISVTAESFTGSPGTVSDAAMTGSGPVMASYCHGCGSCELVCPSRLPLSTVIANFAWGTLSQNTRGTVPQKVQGRL